MHEKILWDYKDWQEQGRNFPDLSYEGIIYQFHTLIPLRCPGVLRGGATCSTKLSDGTPNFKTKESNVKCPICKWKGTRIVGQRIK